MTEKKCKQFPSPAKLKRSLPQDMKIVPFYDQSLFVRASAGGARDAILFGLLLSVLIIYLFLKDWGVTLTAVIVIPVTVLATLAAMKPAGLGFNIMTLGGIAAAIGLVIDDAIVVVESIYAKFMEGLPRLEAVQAGIAEVFMPLLGSTLTPVVVFIPLAFLDGITGVFFRALAMTMVAALLTSLLLAITLTPSLAAWLLRDRERTGRAGAPRNLDGGFLLARVIRLYEAALRLTLRHRWLALAGCLFALFLGAGVCQRLDSDFLPAMDEGGFVIDYVGPPGTSLAETHRELLNAEALLKANPDVESFSRRTGAALGFEVVEPNTGDFLVKLKPGRKSSTEDVIADLRKKFNDTMPDIEWEFPGILGDLIGLSRGGQCRDLSPGRDAG